MKKNKSGLGERKREMWGVHFRWVVREGGGGG